MFKLPLFGLNKREGVPSRDSIKMIFGIGNPEDKYTNTYHNVGFLYIDSQVKEKMKSYQDFAFSKQGEIIFAKSFTFMNQSGKSLRQAMKYFGLKPEEVLVVHDDSDLTLGQYKIVFNRGSAGHKGIDSIISHLKTKNFFRLRIGVRENEGKAGDFVLKSVSKSGRTTLEKLFSEIQLFDSSS